MNEMPFQKAQKTATGTAVAPPCVFVIFGASGDLTKRLLMPAIYNLVNEGLLNEDFQIVGINRGEIDDKAFRDKLLGEMTDIIEAGHGEAGKVKVDAQARDWLSQRIHHVTGDVTDEGMFLALRRRLEELTKDKPHNNVVFYLNTAPLFFGPIVEGLGKAGLTKEGEDQFRRIIIEKPFGTDLKSARELDEQILGIVDESQIFRIDHFLGKETVQNIMVLRFANFMFEPIWNRDHIDHIQITAAETVGVEQRGAFYDATGALRDMTRALYSRMEATESFAADVAHELKNPLTSLRSAVETLPRIKAEESRGRLTAIIQHDIRRLDRLISDISDASRLDAELARNRTAGLDVAALVGTVVTVANEVERDDGVRFALTVALPPPGQEGPGYRVMGHDSRLGQVVNNLLDNARSFSAEDGTVRVAVRPARLDEEDGEEGVEIVVDDDGPGIPAHAFERIFERFYTDRPDHGFGDNSGLGLSISRQIVEVHGGTIVAANRLAEPIDEEGDDDDDEPAVLGARFTVWLPATCDAG